MDDYVDTQTLTTLHTLSKTFGLPLFDLRSLHLSSLPTKAISESLIQQHRVLPLYQRGERLLLAIADPTQQTAFSTLTFRTHLKIHYALVEQRMLDQCIDQFLRLKQNDELGEAFQAKEEDVLPVIRGSEGLHDQAEDAPMVRFINQTLNEAIRQSASDIHFEPYEEDYRIRFRIDGLLQPFSTPPIHLASRFSSRLKIMSQLDISERRLPQDGRFRFILSDNRFVDFRVSTCPTVNGEKIVLRILDPHSTTLDIHELGFTAVEKTLFLKNIHRPQGMILVTGPTGSGKTVTLYSALNLLNQSDKNISTAEDPVEIKINGINQVNINVKTGLLFPTVLRTFLRQDPDVIMVGEIRDLETAEMAIKAAQTGHLVLSTLHTNSAAETLNRLVNMGISPYTVASSVSLIIAQRLARRLCSACKQPTWISEVLRAQEGLNAERGYTAKGCHHCTHGFKGRLGLFECLPITPAVESLIIQGGKASQIHALAVSEGMMTLRQSGLKKVEKGLTSLEEINRVNIG